MPTPPLFNSLFGSQPDLGEYFKGEVEEAISPVTERIERVEKKLDLLLLTLQRVESLLIALQPLIKLINKLPFLK